MAAFKDIFGKQNVLGKDGKAVALDTLSSCQLVGLYFSAHWCKSCRRFTPQLASLYDKLKQQNKSFEVIFVSSDRDKASYDEYYASMPWLSLAFDKHDLKDDLVALYGVTALPHLTLLMSDATVVSKEGKQLVISQPDGFPWGLV